MLFRRVLASTTHRAIVISALSLCAIAGTTTVPATAEIVALGELSNIEFLDTAWSFEKASATLGLTYGTLDQRDNPARATAGLYLPPGLPPQGGWPLVVWAHGTIGIGNDCAPSRRPQSERNRTYFNQILDNGYAVLAPDYQGLGTGGNFSYYNTEVEARSILDAVSAARRLPLPLSADWVLVGQSEGAHAVMSAADRYARTGGGGAAGLSGVVATGLRTDPAKSLPEMFRATSTGSANQIGYAAYYLASLEDRHPGSVRPHLSDFGAQFVEKAATTCLSDLVAAADGRRPASLVADPDHPTPSFEADLAELTGYRDDALPTDVMIGYGTADIDVPSTETSAYTTLLQSRNPNITVTVKEYAGKDHSGAFLASLPDTLSFLRSHLR
ncbi:alpha/beta hydrolase [Nocardia yamanashiensis]|uniref:alpha/beta hydrolase n=1 Tax=Nocardia yamanashiensis TaxID=209247 RepID=UPI00082A3DBC|nr:lipase family protein [Nocardia yamanashiensis]